MNDQVSKLTRTLWLAGVVGAVALPISVKAETNCTQLNAATIGTLPYSITTAGCYILTSNITGVSGVEGITISANDVSIDLNGFAMTGVAGSLDGIRVSGTRENIEVRNGTLTNWGRDGIRANTASNCHFADLRLSANAVVGVQAGQNSVVENCTAQGNDYGIYVTEGCLVTDCTARDNDLEGIHVSHGSTVISCSSTNNGTHGITLTTGGTVTQCTSYGNTQDGIRVSTACVVLTNTCYLNGNGGDGAGVHATGSSNRIEANSVTSNDRGIDVDAGDNLIIKNSARLNTTEYSIAAGNHYGAIVTTPGAGFTNSNPWANFDF